MILKPQTSTPSQQYKVRFSKQKKITQLHDLLEDPEEGKNLLSSKQREHRKALAKFRKIVASLPDKDGRPFMNLGHPTHGIEKNN